jgi:hypothetical protein
MENQVELNWYYDSKFSNVISMTEDNTAADFALTVTYDKRGGSAYVECYFDTFPIEEYQELGRGVIVEQVMNALDTWYPNNFILQGNQIIAVLKSGITIDGEMDTEDVMAAIATSEDMLMVHHELVLLYEVFGKIFYEGADPEQLISLMVQTPIGSA